MQSVTSDVALVAKIVGWLDDIPSIVRSSGVIRSFREATKQAAHTSLVISAYDKGAWVEPNLVQPPSLSNVVEWMRSKHKLLSELSSVHIPARMELEPCDLVSFGIIFQKMLCDSRPTEVKIAADLLCSDCHTWPGSVRNMTGFNQLQEDRELRSISAKYQFVSHKLERLVVSYNVSLCIENVKSTWSSMKQLNFLQFSRFEVEHPAVDNLNRHLPALQEVKYDVFTDVDGRTLMGINKLLQVCRLRRAYFSVFSLVRKQIAFQVSPNLEVKVKRYYGAAQIGFCSPIKWH